MATLMEMVSHSAEVIRVPSELNFNKFEDEGSIQNAAVLMGASLLVFSAMGYTISGGPGALQWLLVGLVYYFGYWGLAYLVGKPMGGEATWLELAYTHALFMGPLLVGFGLVCLAFNSFGYLQVAGSYTTLVFLGVSLYYSVRCIQGTMNFYDPVKVLGLMGGLLAISFMVYRMFL